MVKRITFPIILLASLTFVCSTALAEIYKWKDENGNVVFSERKPSSAKAEFETLEPRIDKSRAPADRGDRGGEREDQDAAGEDKEAVAEEQRKAREQAEKDQDIRERNCNAARDRLVSLQRPRINKVESDGTRRVIGEEERQAGIAEAEKAVKNFCSAPQGSS